MQNFMNAYRRNVDRGMARAGLPATWAPAVGVCLAMAILVCIATVVVLSLLGVYLPRKGDDITVGNYPQGQRTLDLVFATNLASTPQGTVNSYNSLGQQMNERLGYSQDILSVRSATLANSAIKISKNKKKRQTGAALSCDAVSNSTNAGDNLGIQIYISKCPRSKCLTDHCLETCVPEVKSEIQSKLGSASFLIIVQTTDGNLPTTVQFCFFGEVVPGRKEKPEAICLSSNTSTKEQKDRE